MYYNYKTYPSTNSKSVIFFAAPFGIKIKQLNWAIKSLQKEGYTVVAYDADDKILTLGKPELLEETVRNIAVDIKDQIDAYKSGGYTDFGFFGSSLGAFLMYYCVATIPELKWGVLNTGGDAAEAVWRHPELRKLHQKLGTDPDFIARAWRKLQYPRFKNMRGKRILFVSSNFDFVLPRSEIDPFLEPMRQAGAKVEVMEVNIWGHNLTVLFGLIQAKKLIKEVHQV
ncbi:alpha/beta hydrolase [bacterium]|nr:alpha/beta hydrolase [bacterium]